MGCDKTKQKIRAGISANLFSNCILSSDYYLPMRHYSQIPNAYLSFQIDSPLQLNTCNISQPLFTCSNHLNGKEIEKKLHSIVLIT